MGAVYLSKIIGDLAFAVFQDLSQPVRADIPFDRSPRSEDVIVAVIDTGIDLNQKLLKDHVWRNPGETGLDSRGQNKATNGIDDDGNGFIDDVHGWNFAANSEDINDTHGHGTHISGIIAADPSDDGEFRGLAPNAKIMVLKYYDPRTPGLDNLRNSIRALEYAVQMGAKIINYSGGGVEANEIEKGILREANRRGILLVAAAGNEKSNSDDKPFFPAGYDLPNILSVTALDRNHAVLPSSNYGKKSVDVAAPGLKILSTLPSGKLGYMTGTSQATAYVSGTAAQILISSGRGSKFPVGELKRRIIQTVARSAALREKTKSGGRVELSRTISMRDRNTSLTDLHLINTSRLSAVIFSPEFHPQSTAIPRP